MKNGDITNQGGYTIGVRCEDCLIKFKNEKVVDKLKNFFIGSALNAEVDEEVLSLIKHIYWNTEMNVTLVVDDKNFTPELQKVLEDLPYNQVFNVLRSISEVTSALNTGQLTYFVSNDINDRLNANSKYAVSTKEFNTILKRGI